MNNHNLLPKIILVLCVVLLYACGGEQPVIDPDTIEGKRSLLAEKLESRKALDKEISSLRKTIKDEDPTMKKTAKTVTVDTIKIGNFEKFVTIQGNVEAGDIVKAVPEMGGRILSITVREGDYVKRGQLIARLDGESANKQLAEIQTTLDLAKTVYERQERLWKQNIGSEIQYLEAKSNKDRLERTMETIRYQQSKTNVYAPISGVINKEFAEVGELAPAGMPIVEILNTRSVKVVADLPENYLGIVKKGANVAIDFPTIGQNTMGKISLVGRSIDPANRTFKVEVELSNKKGDLKPNLLAEMKLEQDKVGDVMTVPLELVQEDVSGNVYVYTAERDGDRFVAKKNQIQMGNSYDGKVIIKEGLETGAVVIIDGARLVKDGEEIIVKA